MNPNIESFQTRILNTIAHAIRCHGMETAQQSDYGNVGSLCIFAPQKSLQPTDSAEWTRYLGRLAYDVQSSGASLVWWPAGVAPRSVPMGQEARFAFAFDFKPDVWTQNMHRLMVLLETVRIEHQLKRSADIKLHDAE